MGKDQPLNNFLFGTPIQILSIIANILQSRKMK